MIGISKFVVKYLKRQGRRRLMVVLRMTRSSFVWIGKMDPEKIKNKRYIMKKNDVIDSLSPSVIIQELYADCSEKP